MGERKCVACRARDFADTVDDENLRSALLAFAPPHTCKKNPPAGTASTEAEKKKEDIGALKTLDVIAFNRSAEKRFVEIALTLVPCPVSYLVRETAYALNISTETAKRYLLKHSASKAEFEIKRGVVVLRQEKQVV